MILCSRNFNAKLLNCEIEYSGKIREFTVTMLIFFLFFSRITRKNSINAEELPLCDTLAHLREKRLITRSSSILDPDVKMLLRFFKQVAFLDSDN